MSTSLKKNTDSKAACRPYKTTSPVDALVHSQPFSPSFPALENQHNMLHQCREENAVKEHDSLDRAVEVYIACFGYGALH